MGWTARGVAAYMSSYHSMKVGLRAAWRSHVCTLAMRISS